MQEPLNLIQHWGEKFCGLKMATALGSELWSQHDEAKSPGQGREVTQMIVSLS